MDVQITEQEFDISNYSAYLDGEFRQILSYLKPQIMTINNNDYLTQIRLWLEKLSKAEDKELRNRYLIEIANQIQCGNIECPFIYVPPVGPLEPLPLPCDNLKYPIPQEFCYYTDLSNLNKAVSFEDGGSQSVYPNCAVYPQNSNEIYGQAKLQNHAEKPTKLIKRHRMTNLLRKKLPTQQELPESDYNQYNNNNKQLPNNSSNLSQNVNDTETNPEQTKSVEDDSSWCDLTDVASDVGLACGDTERQVSPKNSIQQIDISVYENKLNNMIDKIQGLKEKSNRFRQLADNPQNQEESYEGYPQCADTNKDVETKSAVNKPSDVVDEWRKNILKLQNQLSTSLKQNAELKCIIVNLEKQLNDVEIKKVQEKNSLKKKVSDLHNKEIKMLKQLQLENLRNLEIIYKKRSEEMQNSFETRVKEINESFENKIIEMRDDFQKTIKDKDAEISRLDTLAQQQCVRLSIEINALRNQLEESATNNLYDERVLFLQKCVAKMDKLFKKSEREYTKQIEKLKQELELKDKTTQIQIKTERAEMVASAAKDQQSHWDSIVNDLECRYAKMLEMQQQQAFAVKKKDEETIESLKRTLEQHGIAYT